jgi:predicted transcriptional regulator
MFSIKSKREQQKLLKTRIREYMRVLRTGFIKDVLDNLVWEDLELLPEGHRMKPPYKISIYTKEDPMEYLTKAQELSDIYLQNNPFILEEEE